MNTVFGHLALQFATHPENLATEALGFILNNSTSASHGFSAFLRTCGIDCDEDLHFGTQCTGADDSRPDMNCMDGAGHIRIVVENKFWAGLTDNQPVTYFKALPDSPHSAVLFVVPEARLTLVWNDVMSRCCEAGLGFGVVSQLPSATFATINSGHKLAITSWKRLLGALSIATASPEDVKTQGDIAQLQGLCEAMDTQAFLPLRGEEITNLEIPRRVIDYTNLALAIATEAEIHGYCNRKGLRETSFRHCSGTYIRIGSYAAWLGYDPVAWRHLGASPIWVNFYAPPYSPTAEIRERLSRFRTATPTRCFDFEGRVAVPLFLSIGVEKTVLVKSAARQLGELAKELVVKQQAPLAEPSQPESQNEG